MARFHLMQFLPDAAMHGLKGYHEVIQTMHWGLEQLGHEVSYAVNRADASARNILFGAHLLPMESVDALPGDSIVYNLEQIRHLHPSRFTAAWRRCAERFDIWEYSAANMPTWRQLPGARARVVPIGYAPTLTRIPRVPIQDIDVLMYGLSGAKRVVAFHELSMAGVAVVFVSGLYGGARDALIGRSKLVLNVNLYDASQIFEETRVSYLLANGKAVVATLDANTFVEDDIRQAVKFTTPERLAADCRFLLDHDGARQELEAAGFAIMSRRDIRGILRAVVP